MEEVPQSKLKNFSVAIESLRHVTHKKEFKEICKKNRSSYTFEPKKKKGKSGYKKFDGSPMGHSFIACDTSGTPSKESRYRYVKPDEALLPGYFSWWSVSINLKRIPKCTPNHMASTPFSRPHCSPYGSIAIHGCLEWALQSYQDSLPKDPSINKLPKIELRNGGTLRYKFEVCHVIIVCAANEKMLPYKKYQIWREGNDKVHFDECTGKISKVDPIKITIKNGMKIIAGKFYSWDQIVFAFHFPDDKYHMKCPKSKFKKKQVKHKKCVKTRPKYGEFLCPDEIYASENDENTRNGIGNKRKRCDDSREEGKKSKRMHLQ